MKLTKYIFAAAMIGSLSACSIDEEFKSQLEQENVYTTIDGYNGLINACYQNMYFMYGKEDGIPMMEMGDLWQNGSTTSGSWKECVNNYEWNTECGVNRVIWNALYATIAYCNTAIYYKDQCTGYAEDALNAKVAEAYFMRGFSYFHIVEQWGGVTLTTTSMAEAGARESAYRNTEEEIYDQITSDLEYAYNNLPETQGEDRGRATKYAAAAMLSKVWLQRTRLERDKAENPDGKTKWKSVVTNDAQVKYTAKQCAEKAWEYAEIVITSGKYDLYKSDATQSGNAKEWDGMNNKNNSEFIFVEAIDHENGYNPEGWNRGRTRQYYEMNISSSASNFGINSEGVRYGRANTGRVHPSLYLLNECFDPLPQEGDYNPRNLPTTPDTRFADAFYYKYYISQPKFVITRSNWILYGKDVALYDKNGGSRNYAVEVDGFKHTTKGSLYTIPGNIKTGASLPDGMNYWSAGSNKDQVFEMEDDIEAMGCFTPNWPLDSAWCAHRRFICGGTPVMNAAAGSADESYNKKFAYMDPSGSTGQNSNYRSLSPSLRKFSPIRYCYTNQQCMMDFPIIRLTDIYLIAAEASVLADNHKTQGLQYLNEVRRHAATAANASAIEVAASDLNIDFLCKERARELCAENWRWYDLKRMGKLEYNYLGHANPYGQPYQTMWYVRPIPQQLLNMIANPQEYGTNGY